MVRRKSIGCTAAEFMALSSLLRWVHNIYLFPYRNIERSAYRTELIDPQSVGRCIECIHPGSYTESHILDNGSEVKKSTVRIGRGGFGTVYLGVYINDSGQSQNVAMKDNGLCSRNALAVHQQESKIHESVPAHTNIVKYLGCSPICEDSHFIVLEYLPMNLHEAICRGDILSTFRDVLNVLSGVVEGLIHLHEYQIVHFDLKPSNILLSADMTPKIADFGISRVRLDNSITAALKGTKGYMAPELMVGGFVDESAQPCGRGDMKKRVTDSVDIFSFGMIAYVCVVGGILPNVETRKRLIEEGKVVKCGGFRPIQAACDCPRPLRGMIEKCLQFDLGALDTRFFGRPTAFELRDMIANMINNDWVDDLLPRIEGIRI